MPTAITPVIQPTPVDRQFLMLDSYARIIAMFVRAVFDAFGQTPDSAASPLGQVRPIVVNRFFTVPDGATYSFWTQQDSYFLGAAIVYTGGQLTVGIDGASQSEYIAGAFRELTGMIGAGSSDSDNLGKIRRFLPANTKISLGVNSGPKIVCLAFEPAGSN